MVFALDCLLCYSCFINLNPACTLRRDFGIVGAICDLLVSYAKGNKKALCLVESKRRDIKHAVEQILNTHKYLYQASNRTEPVTWKAYIHQYGSSPNPKDRKWIKKELERIFNKGDYRISRESDLGNFLRQ